MEIIIFKTCFPKNHGNIKFYNMELTSFITFFLKIMEITIL